jgi:hypothetical protein
MAADSARERVHAASPDALLPRLDALLAELREVNGGELAPVADLLHAVHEADNSQLPDTEATDLGAAAKRALDKVTAKAPATAAQATSAQTTSVPAASAPATRVLTPAPSGFAADDLDGLDGLDDLDGTRDEVLDDLVETLYEALDDVEDAVDDLVQAITSNDEPIISNDGVITPTDSGVLPEEEDTDLLTAVADLLDALLGGGLEETTTFDPMVPSTQTPTAVPPALAGTLPPTTALPQVLLPTP